MTLREIKQALRNGKYAWPGGYPLYFVTHDGAALSFDAVRKCWRRVVQDHLDYTRGGYQGSGWRLIAVDTNWEDPDLFCAHSNERIESAYAD